MECKNVNYIDSFRILLLYIFHLHRKSKLVGRYAMTKN